MKKLFFRGSPRFWIFLACSFLALFLFHETSEHVFTESPEKWNAVDQSILAAARAWRSPALNQVMTDLTALGSISVISLFALVAITLLIFLKDVVGLLYLVLALLGSLCWPNVLKPIYSRARPEATYQLAIVGDYSFPSGHTFGATTCYIAFAFLAARHFQTKTREAALFALAALAITLVGVSRIYLGVHYPTDVLAGMAAGAAWTLFLSACFVQKHRQVRTDSRGGR